MTSPFLKINKPTHMSLIFSFAQTIEKKKREIAARRFQTNWERNIACSRKWWLVPCKKMLDKFDGVHGLIIE